MDGRWLTGHKVVGVLPTKLDDDGQFPLVGAIASLTFVEQEAVVKDGNLDSFLQLGDDTTGSITGCVGKEVNWLAIDVAMDTHCLGCR